GPRVQRRAGVGLELSATYRSGCEAEAPLHGVVVVQIDLEAVLRNVDLVVVGFADEGRRARNRREDAVVEGGRLAGRSLERLQVRLDRSADLERSAGSLDLECDRSPLDREDFADELREVRNRAAELSGPDVQQRLLLIVSCSVVEVNDDAPVSLEN